MRQTAHKSIEMVLKYIRQGECAFTEEMFAILWTCSDAPLRAREACPKHGGVGGQWNGKPGLRQPDIRRSGVPETFVKFYKSILLKHRGNDQNEAGGKICSSVNFVFFI